MSTICCEIPDSECTVHTERVHFNFKLKDRAVSCTKESLNTTLD
ncbi:MAG: hypothetical protein S4CHLAM20_00140 [Chlamydiia bacterium]|nr:hypothetical protein [Chlamydiia bacterium]